MRRLLLPLDVGTELWVDPHTRLDFAAREALAHRICEDADASRLGYFMNRTLLQDACSQLVVSRRNSYDWAMPSTLPKSGPTITASEPSLRGPAAGTGGPPIRERPVAPRWALRILESALASAGGRGTG
jgi:hypothetical protein